MNRRATGFGFITLAVTVFIMRYVCAALFGLADGREGFSYRALLRSVGRVPIAVIIACCIIGIAYLVWAEISERRA